LDEVPPALAAHTLRVAGTTAWFFGQPELTLERCRQGLAIFEELDDERGVGLMYSRIAPPLMEAGDLEDAAKLLEKAAEIHRRAGEEWELAVALELLAAAAWERGELREAAELYEQSIASQREHGDYVSLTRPLLSFGELKIDAGELEAGIVLYREALELAWRYRVLMDVGMCFGALAGALSRRGDNRQAAILWGAGERLDEELGQTQWRSVKAQWEARLAAAVLADTEGIETGKALPTADAVGLALSAGNP